MLFEQLVLMRSSQPLTGPSSRRSKEDERLINSVLGPGKRGYIVDTRTQAVAQAAKVWHCCIGYRFTLLLVVSHIYSYGHIVICQNQIRITFSDMKIL